MLIEELEFPTDEEKHSNIVKVKGVYAQYLFNAKNLFSEAISVLETLNASPLDIVEFYPDILDEGSQEKSDPTALFALSQYLSRERAKLVVLKHDLAEQIKNLKNSARSMSNYDPLEASYQDATSLLEFVETVLLQVYLTTDSPLLGSLLRVENSCNYERTVALLFKHKKYTELVDFYRTKGHHDKALTFLQKYL